MCGGRVGGIELYVVLGYLFFKEVNTLVSLEALVDDAVDR